MGKLREVVAAFCELTATFNKLNCDQRNLFQKEMKKYSDLTNSSTFWMQMQALLVGGTGILSGIAGMGSSVIPKTPAGSTPVQIAGFSAEFLRAALKTVSKIAPQVGDAGRTFMQGSLTQKEAGRTLAQQVGIPQSREAINMLDQQRQSMENTIARIEQARQRNAG